MITVGSLPDTIEKNCEYNHNSRTCSTRTELAHSNYKATQMLVMKKQLWYPGFDHSGISV